MITKTEYITLSVLKQTKAPAIEVLRYHCHAPTWCQVDRVEFTAGLSSYIHLTKDILLLSFSTLSDLTKRLEARDSNIDEMRYAYRRKNTNAEIATFCNKLL